MGQSDFTKWLKQECDIFYRDTKGDGHGGWDKTWTRKYYRVPCRVYGVTGNFTIREEGIEYLVESKILTNRDTDVQKGNKVIVGDNHFLVLRAYAPSSDEEHHRTCLLGRMDDEHGTV